MSNLIRAYIIHLITWISTLSKVRWHHFTTKVQSVPCIVFYDRRPNIHPPTVQLSSVIVNLINPNPIVNALSNWILLCHCMVYVNFFYSARKLMFYDGNNNNNKKTDLKSTFHCLSQTTIFKWSNWCKYHTLYKLMRFLSCCLLTSG